MSYNLVYTKRAVKDIKKLDRIVQKRLEIALKKFSKEPLFYADKLIDSRLGSYRFRVGDYRIIFDFQNLKIIILYIGYRSEIYK